MEIQEYQKKSKRTCATIGSLQNDMIHMSLGLITESAEVADVIKKWVAYSKEPDMVNIREELGDLMFYVVNICNFNNWDLRDILDVNIQKLQLRYPDKFDSEKAINRDIKAERKILEGNG